MIGSSLLRAAAAPGRRLGGPPV